MSGKMIALILIAFVLIGGAMNSFFIVDQTQQALVLRFGKPVGDPIREPGLNFKVPFVDSVELFDRRILMLNAEPKAVILEDQDRLIVDAYVTYRITDPLTFYQAVRSERIMNQRLENMVETSLREVLGRENLSTLLSPARSDIMNNIRENVSRLAQGKSIKVRRKDREGAEKVVDQVDIKVDGSVTDDIAATDSAAVPDKVIRGGGFGIEIVDVRMMRTDLPKETSTPIYNRMRSDRQKVAERFRAEGQKESQIIRSTADKERTIILAEAERKAATIRGLGDADATRIFAESIGQDVDFFEFYRALEAYRIALNKDDTTVILSPEHEFLKYLNP